MGGDTFRTPPLVGNLAAEGDQETVQSNFPRGSDIEGQYYATLILVGILIGSSKRIVIVISLGMINESAGRGIVI